MDIAKEQLTAKDLAESQEFAKFAMIVRELTGIAVGICDTDSKLVKLMCKELDFNPICKLILSSTEGHKACWSTNELYCFRAAKIHHGMQYNCHAGLVDFAIPVYIEGKHIATISAGQVLSQPKSKEGFNALCDKLRGIPFNKKELRKAYDKAIYMPPAKLSTVMNLFLFFAEYCCEMGRRLLAIQDPHINSDIIAAKAFIFNNFREDITLSSLAQYIGLSESYLSRLFQKKVGLGFTHYLNIIRLGEAKKLLSLTNLAITEIAFNVGYNSLPHFNRVFKEVEKISPRQYRKQIQVPPINL